MSKVNEPGTVVDNKSQQTPTAKPEEIIPTIIPASTPKLTIRDFDTPPKQAAPEPKVQTMKDIVDRLKAAQEPSDADKAKVEKRAKVFRSLALLNDSVSALGNFVGAAKGAAPIKTGTVLTDYAKKYKEILDERRRKNEYWDDQTVRATLQDKANTIKQALEEYKTKSKAKLEETKHGYVVDELGVKHKNAKDLAGFKQDFTAGENNKDRELKKGIANAGNAAKIKVAGMNNAQSDKNNKRTNKTSKDNSIRSANTNRGKHGNFGQNWSMPNGQGDPDDDNDLGFSPKTKNINAEDLFDD